MSYIKWFSVYPRQVVAGAHEWVRAESAINMSDSRTRNYFIEHQGTQVKMNENHFWNKNENNDYRPYCQLGVHHIAKSIL